MQVLTYPPVSVSSGLANLGSAAAPLHVEQVALLHAGDADVLAPLAAVLLALGPVEPAAVGRVVARRALHQLREPLQVVVGRDAGRSGEDAGGEGGEGEED